MPNIRNMPKWLAFLIPVSLSLALLGAIGCSSNNDDPAVVQPPNEQSGIASITISQGELLPAFREGVRNYGVSTFYAPVNNFSLTVTLKEPLSKLTINGQEAASGVAFPVALISGKTSIDIGVTAEDGRGSSIASVTANVMTPNTRVYIYDSIAGNMLDDAVISIRDARTDELLASGINFPLSAQGTVFLGLEKDKRYNIYARRDDTAMACFADFDPIREAERDSSGEPTGISTVTLYSRRDWVKALPASAPIIEEVRFGNAPTGGQLSTINWNSVFPANYVEDVRENLAVVAVTALAESDIGVTGSATSYGSVSVNVDDMPFMNTGSTYPQMNSGVNDQTRISAGAALSYLNTSVVVDGKRYLRTCFAFNLSSAQVNFGSGNVVGANALSSGEHYLHIVVYDWANNRTDRKVYFNVTSGPTQTTGDPNLSNNSSQWYTARARTYGLPYSLYSRGEMETGEDAAGATLMSADPVGPNGDTVYVLFEYDNISGYRGWELQRTETLDDPNSWKVVRKRVYNTRATQTYFDANDVSADLIGGVTYHYRFRIWNNVSEFITSTYTIPTLPSFNVNLVSPAHGTQGPTLWPTFRFRVTNPAILSKNYADYGRFTLYIRDKDGYEVLKARFEIDYRVLTDGKPAIKLNWPYSTATTPPPVWLDISKKDVIGEDGTKTIDIEPFVTIEDDGTIVIDTKLANDNFGDQFTLFALEPGAAYEWNVFGDQASAGGNWNNSDLYSMYFRKTLSAVVSSYADSYSSIPYQGGGATNGYFTLIIHPSAE